MLITETHLQTSFNFYKLHFGSVLIIWKMEQHWRSCEKQTNDEVHALLGNLKWWRRAVCRTHAETNFYLFHWNFIFLWFYLCTHHEYQLRGSKRPPLWTGWSVSTSDDLLVVKLPTPASNLETFSPNLLEAQENACPLVTAKMFLN